MKIDHVFTNFIAIDNLSINSENIRNFCYDSRSKDPEGRKLSNIGGWQSHDFQLAECLPKLYYEIREKLESIYYYFEFKDELLLQIDNSWININKKHDFNAPHDHGPGLFSGVFYVDAEESMGDIIFISPNAAVTMCISPSMIKTHNPFNSNLWPVTPKTNMLVLFPSYLKHYTEPNLTDKDRISIAFNASIVKQDALR